MRGPLKYQEAKIAKAMQNQTHGAGPCLDLALRRFHFESQASEVSADVLWV